MTESRRAHARSPSSFLRRFRWPSLILAAVAVALLLVAVGIGIVRNRQPVPAPAPAPTASARPSPSEEARALPLPRLLFGFYSAGLRFSRCYGSCGKGDRDDDDQQAARKRISELRQMGVNYVVNNQTISDRFRRNPDAIFALLADLHRNGIRVSYEVSSGFAGDQFDRTRAEEAFAATDLDGDGVSDLDGYLDVLFQGHEVMESAMHEERVRTYRVAKKWFPTTPVSVYYGGFMRPYEEPNRPHPKRGEWRDYAYGPGEADVVHITVTAGRNDGFNPQHIAAAARERVQIVMRTTPGVPVVIHTSFAGDDSMESKPDSMWTSQELRRWYGAMVSVPGVRGVLLRSYGRFTYDLANPSFVDQRRTWADLGVDVARRNRAASDGAK